MEKADDSQVFRPFLGPEFPDYCAALASLSTAIELLNVVGLAMGTVPVFIQLRLLRIVPNVGTTGRSALTRLLVPTSYCEF